MQECKLYKKQGSIVQCTACNHQCRIAEGKTGICGVRKNMNGKLNLLVYGKVVAKNTDPVEKKPLYHFLPGSTAFSIGTLGCNFRCGFCQNYDISQSKEFYGERIIGEQVTPEQIVNQAIKNRCKSIAYTYNEPAIFIEFVHDTAKLARQKGLKNIMVTNGYMTEDCLKYIAPYIDAMNIDLKSFSEDFYQETCKARLKPVLETIKQAHKESIWTEITTLLIPKENDSEQELTKIAEFISGIDKNIPWHISRFFPLFRMSHKPPTTLSTLKKAEKIGKKCLNHVYIGNIPYDIHSNTYCPECKKPVIERDISVKNKLNKGLCPYCGNRIKGVFE